MAIEITAIEIGSDTELKLKITGTLSAKEAQEAAEEWSNENNCLIMDKVFFETDGAFYMKVCSDDYD
ncbi:MAG: hypothetical protein M3015_13240 [Bacteroidota bacterium]|nr:hypothetical protein [Bacteroidota bacterium]